MKSAGTSNRPRKPSPTSSRSAISGVKPTTRTGNERPKTLELRLRLGLCAPSCFEQEPCASFRFVDPHLEQARRRNVVIVVAKAVRAAHFRSQLLVVLAKLGKHVERRDVIGVIVEQPFLRGDLADRAERRP